MNKCSLRTVTEMDRDDRAILKKLDWVIIKENHLLGISTIGSCESVTKDQPATAHHKLADQLDMNVRTPITITLYPSTPT